MASADINSSFTMFYIVLAVLWSYLLSSQFAPSLRTEAFVLCALFALVVYVFRFLLLQFGKATTVLNMIVLYFGLSAGMYFISAVRGPLAPGTIPVIGQAWVGSFVTISSGSSYFFADVFIFYGGVTLLFAFFSASLCELLYNAVYRLIPRPFRKWLESADLHIDTASEIRVFDFFLLREGRGVIATVAVLAAYAAAYLFALLR